MQPIYSFSEVLEAIEVLSVDEQETLLSIISNRIHERGRKQLKADIEQARNEYREGICQAASIDSLMAEILS
ncbi:hypothetical protein [Methylocucumis oryzae]|uniref:Uncharacterized protein n=1 Tax=Methylocucumis oryzae TaxID=1632867 RepID=A0A0F3IGN6_9GAMM|nr:hypothetical protein [Methylocucumis oryzae]KJV05965.1 hypothetical protein VZ94_14415 [Methylocucumis oryzae]